MTVTVRSSSEGWLDVERAAMVEITAEDKDYPVESAFASGEGRAGAAQNGGRKRSGSCLTSRKV
jgi:hypothetical protein